jgi:hypothetical protein
MSWYVLSPPLDETLTFFLGLSARLRSTASPTTYIKDLTAD